jgi:hypothetical protein
MRLTFWVLLLVNLVLFFWSQGYLGEHDKSREPQRMARQVAPEKLRVLPVEVPPPIVCKRIEGLTEAEIEGIKGGVASAPDWQSSVVPAKLVPAFLVLIPNFSDRAAADKKKSELRKSGINEVQVVEDAELGPFALLMGMFRNQSAAEQLMQTLSRKNVHALRMTKREVPPEKLTLDLRAPADLMAAKLPGLMATLPNASQAECPDQ